MATIILYSHSRFFFLLLCPFSKISVMDMSHFCVKGKPIDLISTERLSLVNPQRACTRVTVVVVCVFVRQTVLIDA